MRLAAASTSTAISSSQSSPSSVSSSAAAVAATSSPSYSLSSPLGASVSDNTDSYSVDQLNTVYLRANNSSHTATTSNVNSAVTSASNSSYVGLSPHLLSGITDTSDITSSANLDSSLSTTTGSRTTRNGVKRGFDSTTAPDTAAATAADASSFSSNASSKRLQMSGYGQAAAQQQTGQDSLSPTSSSMAAVSTASSDASAANAASQTPCRVLLLRNLFHTVNELDVEQLVSPFCRGVRPKIYLQASAGHAFVEFADEHTASAALHYLKMHPISLKGTVVQATFSRRDSVTTMEEKIEPFRVVLASVTNIVYAVDIDLINFLFSKYGVVEKIVTFSKTPAMYQALVQFAETDQAKAAMLALHNRNIYDGCNSLQIQPSRLQELTVKINSSKSWDFTVAAQQQQTSSSSQTSTSYSASGGGGGAAGQCPSSILPTPQGSTSAGSPAQQATLATAGFGTFPSDLSKAGHHLDMSSGMPAMLHMHHAQQLQQMQQMPHQQLLGQAMGQQGGLVVGAGGIMHPHGHGVNMRTQHALLLDKLPRELKDINLDAANPHQTPVIIVYNLSAADITVMKLFNLFSLYGTVLRIKVLREKQDTALIQFSDPLYATIAYNFLQGAPVFQEDAGIQIGYSKNIEVKLPPQGSSDTETDQKRTRAFGMKDQRYGQTDDVEKYLRGASRPMCTLFIANIHEDASEEELTDLFRQYGEIRAFKFRPGKEGSRKRMAFVEMASEKESILALCNLHNYRLREASIKVAFSKTNIANPSSPATGAAVAP